MSSYYKKIGGKNFDRAMLDIAEDSVAGKGDGRISLTDSRSIIKQIKDGGKITDIEKRTLNYILENYKLTETALKHIEKSLVDDLGTEIKKDIKAEKHTFSEEVTPQVKSPSSPAKGGKKTFIILVLILLAAFAVFSFFKYFYKNFKTEPVKTENTLTESKNETSAPIKEEITSPKTEAADTTIAADKTEVVQVKPLEANEYQVKDKDTLIKISEALYGDYKKWEEIFKLNKGKIKNPNILYTGQILTVPEKK